MEETKKYKPRIIKEIIYLALGVAFLIITLSAILIYGNVTNTQVEDIIYTVFISSSYILFFIGLALISTIVQKIFTTYYITPNNEIILKYEFLNRDSKVFRIDQITSVELSQTLIDKIVGAGDVAFDVFGGGSQEDQQTSLQRKFSTVNDYEEIYNLINEQLNIEKTKPIYITKPKQSPNLTFLIIETILLISFLTYIYVTIFNSSNGVINPFNEPIKTVMDIVPIIIQIGTVVLFFSIISRIINIFKIKKTSHTITQNYTETKYNYLLKKSIRKIPIKKITNITSQKNLISHSLFGIGTVIIYTGGAYKPYIPLLENFKKFEELLSKLHKGESQISNTSNQKEEEPSQIYFTSPVFVAKKFINNLIYLVTPLFIAILLFDFLPLHLLTLVFFIFAVNLIINTLWWKNLKYEMYDYKIIKQSGIITKSKKEIQFKNIKYISYHRSLILDRIAKTGTIHIYTAGTKSEDKSIISIEEYQQLYETLKKISLKH